MFFLFPLQTPMAFYPTWQADPSQGWQNQFIQQIPQNTPGISALNSIDFQPQVRILLTVDFCVFVVVACGVIILHGFIKIILVFFFFHFSFVTLSSAVYNRDMPLTSQLDMFKVGLVLIRTMAAHMQHQFSDMIFKAIKFHQ